jgi:hypothetical protein
VNSEKFPNPCGVAVALARNTALLEHILEPMRRVARDAGYAITVHGSLARDIDLVAIPCAERTDEPDYLVTRLAAAVASITGRCNAYADWEEKPHGRRAKSILVWGERFGSITLDLSVMPRLEKEPKETPSLAEKACKNKRKRA